MHVLLTAVSLLLVLGEFRGAELLTVWMGRAKGLLLLLLLLAH
jgi:hypothetical protein